MLRSFMRPVSQPRRALACAVVLAAFAAHGHAQQATGLALPQPLAPEGVSGIHVGVSPSQRVRAGAVSVGVSGTQMSVKEAWRTREDRSVKYDVAQAYAQYYCASSNVLTTEGEWNPGLGTRAGYYTYEDTVRFKCLHESSVLAGGAPGGLKWSKFAAAAWLAPYAAGSDTLQAELRFGSLRPNEATTLVQFALFHAGTAFRNANCKTARLPMARYIETAVLDVSARADALLTVRFACD